jgi:hypothetical protein
MSKTKEMGTVPVIPEEENTPGADYTAKGNARQVLLERIRSGENTAPSRGAKQLLLERLRSSENTSAAVPAPVRAPAAVGAKQLLLERLRSSENTSAAAPAPVRAPAAGGAKQELLDRIRFGENTAPVRAPAAGGAKQELLDRIRSGENTAPVRVPAAGGAKQVLLDRLRSGENTAPVRAPATGGARQMLLDRLRDEKPQEIQRDDNVVRRVNSERLMLLESKIRRDKILQAERKRTLEETYRQIKEANDARDAAFKNLAAQQELARKTFAEEELQKEAKIQEQKDVEQLEQQRLEQQRLEQQRLEQQRLEQQRLEQQRLEQQLQENIRTEARRQRNIMLELEQRQAAQLQLNIRLEEEKQENERIEAANKEARRKERADREAAERNAIELRASLLEAQREKEQKQNIALLEARQKEEEEKKKSLRRAQELETRLKNEALASAKKLLQEQKEREIQLEKELQQQRLEAERILAEELEAEKQLQAMAEQKRITATAAEEARRQKQILLLQEKQQKRARLRQGILEGAMLQRIKLQEQKRETEQRATEQLRIQELEAIKKENQRLAEEQLELDRKEARRLSAEKLEADKIERLRQAREQLEVAQQEAERLERERLQAEQLEIKRQQDAEQLEVKRQQDAKLEAERTKQNLVEAQLAQLQETKRQGELLLEKRKRESRDLAEKNKREAEQRYAKEQKKAAADLEKKRVSLEKSARNKQNAEIKQNQKKQAAEAKQALQKATDAAKKAQEILDRNVQKARELERKDNEVKKLALDKHMATMNLIGKDLEIRAEELKRMRTTKDNYKKQPPFAGLTDIDADLKLLELDGVLERLDLVPNLVSKNPLPTFKSISQEEKEAALNEDLDYNLFDLETLELKQPRWQRFSSTVKGTLVKIGEGVFRVKSKDGMRLVMNALMPGYGLVLPVATDLVLKIIQESKGLAKGDGKAYKAVVRGFVDSVGYEAGNLVSTSLGLGVAGSILCKAFVQTRTNSFNDDVEIYMDGMMPTTERLLPMLQNQPDLKSQKMSFPRKVASAIGAALATASLVAVAQGSPIPLPAGIGKTLTDAAGNLVSMQTLTAAISSAISGPLAAAAAMLKSGKSEAESTNFLRKEFAKFNDAVVDGLVSEGVRQCAEHAAELVNACGTEWRRLPASVLEQEQKLAAITERLGQFLTKGTKDSKAAGSAKFKEDFKTLLAEAKEINPLLDTKWFTGQFQDIELKNTQASLSNANLEFAQREAARIDFELEMADKVLQVSELVNRVADAEKVDPKVLERLLPLMSDIIASTEFRNAQGMLDLMFDKKESLSVATKLGVMLATPKVAEILTTGAVNAAGALGKGADVVQRVQAISNTFAGTRSGVNLGMSTMMSATIPAPLTPATLLQTGMKYAGAATAGAKVAIDAGFQAKLNVDIAKFAANGAAGLSIADAIIKPSPVLPGENRGNVDDSIKRAEDLMSVGQGLNYVGDKLASLFSLGTGVIGTISDTIDQVQVGIARPLGLTHDWKDEGKRASAAVGIALASMEAAGGPRPAAELEEFYRTLGHTSTVAAIGDNRFSNYGRDMNKLKDGETIINVALKDRKIRPDTDKVERLYREKLEADEKLIMLQERANLDQQMVNGAVNSAMNEIEKIKNDFSGLQAQANARIEQAKNIASGATQTGKDIADKKYLSAALGTVSTALDARSMYLDAKTLAPAFDTSAVNKIDADFIVRKIKMTTSMKDAFPEIKDEFMEIKIRSEKSISKSRSLPRVEIVNQGFVKNNKLDALDIVKLNFAEAFSGLAQELEDAIEEKNKAKVSELRNLLRQLLSETAFVAETFNDNELADMYKQWSTKTGEKNLQGAASKAKEIARNIARRLAQKVAGAAVIGFLKPPAIVAGTGILKSILRIWG